VLAFEKARIGPEGAHISSEGYLEYIKGGVRENETGSSGEVIVHDELIGSKVKNQQGEELGELSDLLVDVQNGQVGYGILEHGGTLGIGSSLTAVPMERFTFQPQGADQHPVVTASISKEELKTAPSFKSSEWPEVTSREWNQEINTYYDSEPYYVIYGFLIETGEPRMGTFDQGQKVSLRGTIQSIERNATGPGLDQAGVQIQLKVDQDMPQPSSAGQQPDAPSAREGARDRQSAGERPKLEGQTVTVNLAPESFLKQEGCELNQNDQVTIQGFRTSEQGRMLIVAQSIQKGGTSVTLRGRDGQPKWSGVSGEQKQSRERESQTPGKSRNY
jgi:sporulation protein YlmC with PRC-barrel domain